MYIRKSMGDTTLDIGPGANIWMAAAFVSTAGTGVSSAASDAVGSTAAMEGVSDGVETGTDVDVEAGVGVKVGTAGRPVAEGANRAADSGEEMEGTVIPTAGVALEGAPPQPAMNIAPKKNKIKRIDRPIPIIYSARS